MKLLITSIGKRVSLIKNLREHFTVIGTEVSDLAPAIEFVDKTYYISKVNEENYCDDILKICKDEKIDMLIPLYEKEFIKLHSIRKDLKEIGTTLLLSDKSIIDICNDKRNTYKFFKENNIPTPITYTKENTLIEENTFPMIIKPFDGMGSSGVFKINNTKELKFFLDYVENPIVQQCIEGIEYTIDVLCDLKGNIISIVPRERLEVRSGEVSKSKIVKNKDVIESTRNLIRKLKDNCGTPVGPITVQCFLTKEDDIKFIEINPRFGGGVTLSFEAGIDYGRYFKMMLQKKEIKEVSNFKEITMLRYDEAVYK